MSHQPKHLYEFGPFRLDAEERLLLRDGESLSLTPKSFDLLLALVEHHGHLLEKDELLKLVWPDTFVEEANLSSNISLIRKALGDGENGQRYIETAPKRGYRFVAPVREEEEAIAAAPRAQSPTPAGDASRQIKWMKPRLVFVISLASLLLIVAVVAIGFWPAKRQPAAPVAAIKSIAVLPFKPLNPNEGDAALGLGLADALITKLSGLRQIVVRSTNSVRKYDAVTLDPLAAGREQQVEVVLEANYQHVGERLRVTLNLVRVRDGQSLWSGKFDEKFNDIFRLQDEISEKVATALAPQLTGAEKKSLTTRGTTNRDAYLLYLRGRALWGRGDVKCREKFEQAIDLDPTYALAYTGLAHFYNVMGLQERLPPQEAFPKGKAFAMKALEIDDTLAEAHNTLAESLLFYYWDFPGAESEVQRALDLDSKVPEAWNTYSWYLRIMGRSDEAVAAIRRGADLEPVSSLFSVHLARELYSARRYDEAITQSQKTLELDPEREGAHCILANAYERLGKHAEAAAERSKASQMGLYQRYAHDYAINGYQWTNWEELRRELARLQTAAKTELVRPIAFARLHARLGEKDQAFFWLDKTYQEHSGRLLVLKSDPNFDGLRSDTRYAALLRRIGLEP